MFEFIRLNIINIDHIFPKVLSCIRSWWAQHKAIRERSTLADVRDEWTTNKRIFQKVLLLRERRPSWNLVVIKYRHTRCGKNIFCGMWSKHSLSLIGKWVKPQQTHGTCKMQFHLLCGYNKYKQMHWKKHWVISKRI